MADSAVGVSSAKGSHEDNKFPDISTDMKDAVDTFPMLMINKIPAHGVNSLL